jgi:hypothetical protein
LETLWWCHWYGSCWSIFIPHGPHCPCPW